MTEPPATAAPAFARSARSRPYEIIAWVAAVAVFFLLPSQAALCNEIAVLALFALSLDLILGYAGVISLGHAAFFGFGAYAAALFAKHVIPDPLAGLVVAGAATAALGLAASAMIFRGSDLTRLMVTLGVSMVLLELANKFDNVTGGIDGLQGIAIGPLLGRFAFDLTGRVAYAYSLAVLLVFFIAARRIVHSPFGYELKAIRENRLRAMTIGIPVNRRLAAVYALGAAYAGVAGALLAQTTGFVSLDALEFHRSAEVLLVLVIGGTGYLYGGLIGAIVFKLMQDALSAATPQYWQFWLGLLLVAIVLIGRARLGAWFARMAARARAGAA